MLKVLLQWKSASVYTNWTLSTFHLQLGLGTFMYHFVSACHHGMPYVLGKNIANFVFENSRFQIAEAFQFLLCDGDPAAVVNESRTCWATIVISSLIVWNIFNIFGDVGTRDGTISFCLRDANAQIVVSHNYSTHVSDSFRPPHPWSPNSMIVTDIWQYIMCPI